MKKFFLFAVVCAISLSSHAIAQKPGVAPPPTNTPPPPGQGGHVVPPVNPGGPTGPQPGATHHKPKPVVDPNQNPNPNPGPGDHPGSHDPKPGPVVPPPPPPPPADATPHMS